MNKKGKILWLALLTGLAGCQEELNEMPSVPQEKPAGLLLKGTLPGGTSKGRAYVNEKGGFFWNATDSLLVTDSQMGNFGAMYTATFSASPESEGQKTAVFQVNLDETDENDVNSFMVPYLKDQARDYSAFVPYTQDRGDNQTLGAYYNYSFPSVQIQEGVTSRHLGRYMLMTSGRIDIDQNGADGNGLTQEGSYVKLPDFSLTHRTSLLRFRVLNRQLNPIEVKRVSIQAQRSNGSTAYFRPQCTYYVISDSVSMAAGAYGTLTVELQNMGNAYYTIPGEGELSVYAALLPNSTEDVEFTFTVETTDAQYKTLAFSGNQIRNQRFEAGTYYTFELLLDHGLNVQAWEENLLDEIQFGQETFSVATDHLALPLEGGQTTLRIQATHPGGWTLTEWPDWTKPEATAGQQGVTNLQLTASPATAERSGTLCFMSGNLRKWVTVRQAPMAAVQDDVITVSAEEMNAPENLRILQDDEPSTVYCDKSQRSFNTAQPLQTDVTDGRLHLRFYSPRKLENVEVWAQIPSLSDEEFLLARFEEVAPFIDFYKDLPFLTHDCTFRTASGKSVVIRKNPYFPNGKLTLRTVSYSEYGRKLQQIRHGWTISFNLFGVQPDGSHIGNWMGIRPVHCREAVALFLNFTYLIDMQEHEDILRANEHLLYGNGGPSDKVTTDRVLAQMRQSRSLNVGLVWSGNGIYGLGGGNTFGVYQGGWLHHYTSTRDCIYIFHELGHVMGYNHDSAFTYGPWARDLMSNFYVNNLDKMPIDSPSYLDSSNNPYLY